MLPIAMLSITSSIALLRVAVTAGGFARELRSEFTQETACFRAVVLALLWVSLLLVCLLLTLLIIILVTLTLSRVRAVATRAMLLFCLKTSSHLFVGLADTRSAVWIVGF